VTDAQPVGRGLYNGNISSMLVNIPQLGDAHLYGYSYDQLNRLTAMNAYTGLNSGNNSFVPSGTTHYRERVSYDGNGNILSYLRNGEGANTSMDNLSYAYNLSGGWLQNNKLRHVTDAVTTTPTGYGDLKNGQASDNYGYDAIGNLIKDESEGIASGGIEWNVYGKISQITKTNGGVTTVIKYTYDATGNRIGKWVQVGAGTPKQTAYVRDASGNVMAIYEKGNSEVNGGLLSQIEVPLYGSSRLGVWRPDREVETTGWELFDTDPMTGTGGGIAGGWERGRVQFELSNHLGNVLVTISDARTAVDDGTYQVLTACPTCLPGFACLPCYDVYIKQNSTPDGVVDYYLPQVLTANDYYPFGMIMPGRKYSEGNYRYGFNGKEKDNDINSLTAYDYGFRIYNPAIGKFLSVDPLTSSYPMLTPYQISSNTPIWAIDLDGLEGAPAGHLPNSPWAKATKGRTWLSVTMERRVTNNGMGGDRAYTFGILDANGNPFTIYKTEKDDYTFPDHPGKKYQYYYVDPNIDNPHKVGIYKIHHPGGMSETMGALVPFETDDQLASRTSKGAAKILTALPAAAATIIYTAPYAVTLVQNGTVAVSTLTATAKAQATVVATRGVLAYYRYAPVAGYIGNKLAEFLDETGSIGLSRARLRLAIDESRIMHIFRDKAGHFIEDLPQTRDMILDIAHDANNLLGGDKYGTLWYAKIMEGGKQVWIQVRGDLITAAGINDVPKKFNSATGLSAVVAPIGGIINP